MVPVYIVHIPCSALVHEQAKEKKQGQTSKEQSFMKSEFSLFSPTTILTGYLLKIVKTGFHFEKPLLTSRLVEFVVGSSPFVQETCC